MTAIIYIYTYSQLNSHRNAIPKIKMILFKFKVSYTIGILRATTFLLSEQLSVKLFQGRQHKYTHLIRWRLLLTDDSTLQVLLWQREEMLEVYVFLLATHFNNRPHF